MAGLPAVVVSGTLSVGIVEVVEAPPAAATAFAKSQGVALVPNANGAQNNGGTLPTSGFPGGYGPSFTDISPESIRDSVINPIASGFDTVVLNGICDIASFLANAQFKSRVEGFASAGGKLIIWDSECTATDYGNFAVPFTTNNPGQLGAQGVLTDAEENQLSSTDSASSSYVNDAAVSAGTDAVGDANVFTTFDSRWFVDLQATNANGANGPAQAYSNVGQGLVIYSGLDKDAMTSANGFDPASTSGAVHLNRIWMLELLQPWDPDGLPHGTPAVGGPVGGPVGGLENPGSGNPSEPCVAASHGSATRNPIDTATGNFWHRFDDLAIPGRGIPLAFSHTYNSLAAATNGPLGYGWAHSYAMSLSTDLAGGAVTVHQENGSIVTFSVAGPTTYSAPPRVVATLVRNADGTFTLTRRARLRFIFSALGQLIQEIDLNNYATTLAYNAAGQLATVTDPANRTLTLTYTGANLTALSDTSGRTVHFAYGDGAGNLTDVTDVNGGITHFTYDASHLLRTMRDPKGGTVTNHYDTSGRVDWQSDQLGRTTTLAYTADSTTITDPKGNVTRENYSSGERTALTRGYGTAQAATWAFSYDQRCLGFSSVTDPNGHATRYTHDSSANRLTTTDALGRTTTNTYDALNDLTSATDPKGVKTTFTYDTAGNLTSRSTPLLDATGAPVATATTTLNYGGTTPIYAGDVTSVVDPLNRVVTYRYDSFGDLTKVIAPATAENSAGNTTTYGYNTARGWRTSMVAPKGNLTGATAAAYTTTYTYDADGRPTTVTDPLGHSTARHYDANRNVDSSTDGDGRSTTYAHDAADEPTTTTRPDGTTERSDYWPDGTVNHRYDGANAATAYGYDPLGRPTTITDALGRTTTVGYDPAGNRISRQDPGGNCSATPKTGCTTFGYDDADQLKTVTYSDATTPNVTNVDYDGDGRRTAMTDGTGTSTWTWDSLGRLTASTNGAGAALGYGYDLANQPTSLTYPGSLTVTRTFDPAGRLASVGDWLGNTTAFAYDVNSNLTTETLPSATGVVDTTTFDAADRLTAISDAKAGSPFAGFSYTRDSADQLASAASTGVVDPAQAYSYTGLGQLAQTRRAHAVAISRPHSLAVRPDGSMRAWGSNSSGQLGNGTTVDSALPVTVSGMTSAVSAAAGDRFSLAVLANGAMMAWGKNASGQLGNGTTTSAHQPVSVTGLSAVVASSAGLDHALALKADGTVWAWGSNAYGQLGNGTTTNSSVPLQVPGVSGVVEIASGNNFNLARTADGSLWAWGQNDFGQVGNGSPSSSPVLSPIKVGGLGKVASVAAAANMEGGGNFVLAVAADGGVWAWGANASGQLGDGTTTNRAVPARVPGLTGVTSVAAGFAHSLALKANGSVWAWGRNLSGQVGDGTTTDPRTTPLQVPGLVAVAVVGGGDRSEAVKADGTVWGWGDNSSGQLGDGTLTNRSSPVAVSGLGPVVATYTYDPADNLTQLASGATMGYDAANQACWLAPTGATGTCATTPAGATAFAYDGRGNRTTATPASGAATTYGYDQANRLKSYGSSATYAYDGDGLRAAKTVSGSSTAFVYDRAAGLPLVLQETTGANTTRYVYGPGGRILETVSPTGTVTYHHQDQLGSTRVLTNATGGVVGTFTYDAYGKPTGSTGTAVTPFGWAGEYRDAETGFQYLRARYYDPATAQFLTRDPLEPITGTPYAYAGNSPLNFTDPTGLFRYRFEFGLGSSSLSPSDMMSLLRSDFGDVFPLAGAPATLPNRGKINLSVYGLPFPVRVGKVSSTGFRFNTEWNHPDWPGWIAFNFFQDGEGCLKLEIKGDVPDLSLGSALGGFAFRKRAYRGISHHIWGDFVDNLRAVAQNPASGSW